MKRHFALPAALLLAILLCAAINGRVVTRFTEDLVDRTAAALENADKEDFDEILDRTKELEDRWLQAQPYLESILLHQELDAITETVSDFSSAAASGDRETLLSAGQRLSLQLRHLAALEQLRLGNIL